MTEYNDSDHRPHASWKGETPKLDIQTGPHGIQVSLDAWGPKDNLYAHIYNQLQSNWGEEPSRIQTDAELTAGQMGYVEKCIAGKTLPNVLESISTMWTIDGISRACTHQIVRTRVGASFMQHGGRDNDWRHRPWRMPETIFRACLEEEGNLPGGLKSSILHPEVIGKYIDKNDYMSLDSAIRNYLFAGKELYATLVDAGIPWQDARRILPIGSTTYIHCNYNYLALKGVLANRLEHIMDWEINCVAQLMLREVRMKMPAIFGKHLGSHSDLAGKAMFAGLDSWPPDQKYPAEYDPSTRAHRPEQNPFWVLHPDSMAGKEIQWMRTNGTYPSWKEISRNV